MKKYWKAACVIVGCWTFLALLFTPQTYLSNLRAPTPLTWSQALGATLALFYVWAALTPLLLWLGSRFAFERLSKAVQRAKAHLAQAAQGGDLDSRFRMMLEDITTGSKF